jgi:hypothetical protein
VTVAAVGVQQPRVSCVPAGANYELADDALAWLAEVVGFELDPWQTLVVRESLAESRPGKWAATEVGLVVPRQNGKGAILEARELVGLFLLGEPLLIHSAHQFKTANEHFLRLTARIEDVPEMKRRVKQIRTGSGEQGVILTGARLRILARKGGSGRGFSAPFVAFDEAMDLPEGTVGDMVPTQSAMPRRQRWFTGSAVDQFEHQNGVVFTRVRERGHRGGDGRLAFFEWSLDTESPELLAEETMRDDDAIGFANPGYGIRIFREAIEDELNSLAARTAAVERYGVGDWPPTSVGGDQVIPIDVWDALAFDRSRIVGPVCLAVDTTPDRSWSSIAAAGLNPDGQPHLEVIAHRRGTDWVVGELAGFCDRHDVDGVVCGGRGAAASLEPECRDREIDLKLLSAADEARAFGLVLDLVAAERLRHLGSDELRQAVKGATKRRLGDAWAWDRRDATVDISPLVAVTLAVWESAEHGWDKDWEPQVW